MFDISTQADAWTYTNAVADHLTAAGLDITDAWADEAEVREGEMGYTGLIELDGEVEAYAWDTARGWWHLTGSRGRGLYDNDTLLGIAEDTPPAESAEKILVRRPTDV